MDYDDMTVEDLRDLADRRGVPKAGRKDDLVARLELADEERGDKPAPEPVKVERAAPRAEEPSAPAAPVASSSRHRTAQQDPERQDKPIRGKMVDERGNDIT